MQRIDRWLGNLGYSHKWGVMVNGICMLKYLVYTSLSFSKSKPLGQTYAAWENLPSDICNIRHLSRVSDWHSILINQCL